MAELCSNIFILLPNLPFGAGGGGGFEELTSSASLEPRFFIAGPPGEGLGPPGEGLGPLLGGPVTTAPEAATINIKYNSLLIS